MLRSTCADAPEMLELVEGFVAEMPALVAELSRLADAAGADDLRQLQRLVHQLKGSGGGYGFMPVTDRAAAVETLLRDGGDLPALRRSLGELTDLLRTLDGFGGAQERTAAQRDFQEKLAGRTPLAAS